MGDTSRIVAWLEILASTTSIGSSNATTYKIIVALLERIEALEADVAALKTVEDDENDGDGNE